MIKLFLPLILVLSGAASAAPSSSRQITAQTIRTGASSIVTLPTTTGTLCGVAESCALTNKTNIGSTSATIGTLSVTGATGLSGALTGSSAALGSLSISGATALGTLSVSSTTGLGGALTGPSATLGTLSVTGNVGIAGTFLSGTWAGVAIPATKGGTGLTSGTSGGIPYFGTTSTIASSGALTANALVLGGGAGATPASMGSLGTTTTLLHGNASGAPTYAAVTLTTDVTGNLPVANGGLAANQIVAAQISSGTSVGSQTGGTWISSVGSNATGDSSLNLTGSFFSAAPYCVCSAINGSTPNGRVCKIYSSSTSVVRVVTTIDNTDAAAAENYYIICFGAR